MKIFENFLQIDIAPVRRALSGILHSKYWTLIFISINTAVCKNFEPPRYINIYWRGLLIWWGVLYPLANIVSFWYKNACRQLWISPVYVIAEHDIACRQLIQFARIPVEFVVRFIGYQNQVKVITFSIAAKHLLLISPCSWCLCDLRLQFLELYTACILS